MANPATVCLQGYRLNPPNDFVRQGENAGIVLVLRLMEDAYTEGWDGTVSAQKYILSQLAQYEPCELIHRMREQWCRK